MSPDRPREKIPLTIAAGVSWGIPFVFDFAAPFAFVCLVPFLLLIGSGRYKGVVLSSYTIGFLYMGLGIGWLWHVWPPLPFVTAGYFGLYALLFGWGLSALLRRTRLPLVVLAPPLFVGMEFLRTYFSVFRTTWLHLANPLHGWTDLIQISRWTGHFGVTFVVILVNAVVAGVVLSLWKEKRLSSTRVVGSMGAAVAVVIAAFIAGSSVAPPVTRDGPTIGVVQANFTRAEFIDYRQWDRILETYIRLTRERGGEGIDLWIWPESAYPGVAERNRHVVETTRAVARDLSTPILFGSLGTKVVGGEERRTNSAYFLRPNGRLAGRYDKRVLVPFGEVIPIVGRIPSVRRRIADFLHRAAGFRPHIAPGESSDPVALPWRGRGVRIGALVCYEAVMPDLARKARRAGADILVNVSNEVWFAEREQDQILAMAKFRAVENGIPLVRATSTGISCVISPRGEVIALLERDGRSKKVSGTLVEQIALVEGGPTFYARWGEVFCLILFLGTGALCAWKWFRR